MTRWPSPFVFFEELAQFYEERGEEQRKHSRAQRYGLLLEFAKERFPDEEDRIRALLTIDYSAGKSESPTQILPGFRRHIRKRYAGF